MAESLLFVVTFVFLPDDTDFVGRPMNRPRFPTLFLNYSTEFVADYRMQAISYSTVKWEEEGQLLAWSPLV